MSIFSLEDQKLPKTDAASTKKPSTLLAGLQRLLVAVVSLVLHLQVRIFNHHYLLRGFTGLFVLNRSLGASRSRTCSTRSSSPLPSSATATFTCIWPCSGTGQSLSLLLFYSSPSALVSSFYSSLYISLHPLLRLKYYFAWKVAEGASILGGFGFEGYTADGQVLGWKGEWTRIRLVVEVRSGHHYCSSRRCGEREHHRSGDRLEHPDAHAQLEQADARMAGEIHLPAHQSLSLRHLLRVRSGQSCDTPLSIYLPLSLSPCSILARALPRLLHLLHVRAAGDQRGETYQSQDKPTRGA